MATPDTATASPALLPGIGRPWVGTILCRFVVPAWLLTGAAFKLSDLNPNLLPPPVRDVVNAMGGAVGADPAKWLVLNMQLMVAVELALVAIMVLVPKFARITAIAILSLFCVILVAELVEKVQSAAFAREGIASLLKPCGCFGAWSPPTIVTFMIDLALLIGCLVCAQGPRARTLPGPTIANAAALASLVVAPVVVFMQPERVVVAPPQAQDGTSQQAEAANPPATDGTTAAPPAPAVAPPANAPAVAWPAMPAKLAPTYVILDKRAVGTPFASLPVAGLLAQQVPADIQSGRKTFIFYRENCDHCFEVTNKHFAGEVANPTYSIKVPDSTGGKTYPNPCATCTKWELPKGPDYMIETPMIMTIVDGTIAAICKDADKPGALEATMNAWLPGADGSPAKKEGVPGMVLAPPPAAPGAGAATAPPAVAPATKPFPPMPSKLEAYYAPQFDKWPGKRLDELDLPLIIERPIPVDLQNGEVVLFFYRIDCDHCAMVLTDHFSGPLTAPTLLVSIPDATGDAFDNPCSGCSKAALVGGPIYVIETPVLVVAKDGVVQHVLSGGQNDNPDDVKAVLPKAAKASP
jgi:hypothetical protein